MMFSRLADGFTDIFMGYVMDRVKTKYGKARHWMLWLAVPIGIACVLVFLVPNTGDLGKYIYVAITYNLVTTFLYTIDQYPLWRAHIFNEPRSGTTYGNQYFPYVYGTVRFSAHQCILPFLS